MSRQLARGGPPAPAQGVPDPSHVVRVDRRFKRRNGALARSWVYFVQAVTNNGRGPIKIGQTTNLQARMRSLATGSPFPLRVLLVIPGSRATESALHREFKETRQSREWFRCTGAIKARIAALREKRDRENIALACEAQALERAHSGAQMSAADEALFADAARDAQRWRERLSAGRTRDDRRARQERVSTRRGGVSAAFTEHLLYGSGGDDD